MTKKIDQNNKKISFKDAFFGNKQSPGIIASKKSKIKAITQTRVNSGNRNANTLNLPPVLDPNQGLMPESHFGQTLKNAQIVNQNIVKDIFIDQ